MKNNFLKSVGLFLILILNLNLLVAGEIYSFCNFKNDANISYWQSKNVSWRNIYDNAQKELDRTNVESDIILSKQNKKNLTKNESDKLFNDFLANSDKFTSLNEKMLKALICTNFATLKAQGISDLEAKKKIGSQLDEIESSLKKPK